jgi:hypothetical protein
MPADHKITVAWQIVALFIPIANFWAFYRIRKLRKYLVYVVIPSIAASIYAVYRVFEVLPSGFLPGDNALAFGDPFAIYSDAAYIATLATSYALFGLSIYLVVKWSRQHNMKYEAQPNNT